MGPAAAAAKLGVTDSWLPGGVTDEGPQESKPTMNPECSHRNIGSLMSLFPPIVVVLIFTLSRP